MRSWPVLLFVVVPAHAAPTFYRDVLPILADRCQICHRAGENGPMALLTYEQARPWAKAIRQAVASRRMPPWFADPQSGDFANDPSLTTAQIQTVTAWVDAGAPAGTKSDAPTPVAWPAGGELVNPPIRARMPEPFPIPARATIPYQRFVLSAKFDTDMWATAVEVRPLDRTVVHHAVVYVREPGATWLDRVPASADVLAVYTPGAAVMNCPEGMAKKIPAGSSLILEMHYTSKSRAASDQTEVSIQASPVVPRQRVLTLQMDNVRLRIPPGERDYQARASGTLAHDALLIGMFPHMHLRGAGFEYQIVGPQPGRVDTLLKVSHYDFYWQLYYRLKAPRLLPAGTRLLFTAHYDNSARNKRNPDPTAEVAWGEQSSEEMMVGFFDVAVPPETAKADFLLTSFLPASPGPAGSQ